ncbi:MAG: alpha/beta hydrolase, partial [Myxococcota bacterium]
VLKGMANFGRTAMGANEEGRLKAELWRDVHKIKHRTLITWGREDRVLPLEGGLFAFRQMENASLHVLPRCGHWAQVEHAREFERLSIDFLTAP